ncbi:MAG: T9SS type A sorting domain-containing protein [Ignavibacteria bacterium]
MGHKIFLLLIISIFFLNECRSQYNLEWVERTIGPDNSSISLIDFNLDKSGNINLLDFKYLITQYDQNSNLIWQRQYPLPGFLMRGSSYSVISDDSGNIYISGEADSISFNPDFLTVKYNRNGILQWSRYFGGPNTGTDRAYEMIVYKNKYLYVLGNNSYADSGNCNFKWTLIKYDLNGNKFWSYQYCGYSKYIAGDYAPKPELAIDSSGNLIISGSDYNTVNSLYELKIIKLDSSGNQVWFKTIQEIYSSGGMLTDVNSNIYIGANGILKLDSNGDSLWYNYFERLIDFNIDTNQNLIATSYTDTNKIYYILINKIDTSGNEIWTSQSPAGLLPISMFTNQNNKIFITAYGVGSERYKYHTLAFNSDGILFWSGVYEVSSSTGCISRKIISDINDNIYVSGNTLGSNPREIITVKYSLITGNSNSVTILPDKFLLNQNYPNPFNPKTIINYELPVTGNAELKIFDVLGNEVAILVNEKQSAGSYKVDFDGSNFASGVYFYRLDFGGNIIGTKRMVLLK